MGRRMGSIRGTWLLVRSPSLLVLFAVTSLYYLNFHIAYVPGSRTRYAVLQTAEYLPFYVFLVVRGMHWLRAGNQIDPPDSTAAWSGSRV